MGLSYGIAIVLPIVTTFFLAFSVLEDSGYLPRLAVMGGGGSLLKPDGSRFVDEPGFPDEYKPEALAQAEALALLRAAPDSLDWTYLSTPPHTLIPGDPRGDRDRER